MLLLPQITSSSGMGPWPTKDCQVRKRRGSLRIQMHDFKLKQHDANQLTATQWDLLVGINFRSFDTSLEVFLNDEL